MKNLLATSIVSNQFPPSPLIYLEECPNSITHCDISKVGRNSINEQGVAAISKYFGHVMVTERQD